MKVFKVILIALITVFAFGNAEAQYRRPPRKVVIVKKRVVHHRHYHKRPVVVVRHRY